MRQQQGTKNEIQQTYFKTVWAGHHRQIICVNKTWQAGIPAVMLFQFFKVFRENIQSQQLGDLVGLVELINKSDYASAKIVLLTCSSWEMGTPMTTCYHHRGGGQRV